MRNYRKQAGGAATLELLIAFAILLLNITAVTLLLNGGWSVVLDSELNAEALSFAQARVEAARSEAENNFNSINSQIENLPSGAITYQATDTVTDLSQCLKQLVIKLDYSVESRIVSVNLATFIGSAKEALALGSDCTARFSGSSWDNPQRFASDTMNPGKPTTIDVLKKKVYIGLDKSPFLAIADARGAILGQNNGLFVTFTNGFNLGEIINAIDVVEWRDKNNNIVKTYAYTALASTTNQFAVIDVSDMYNPMLVARLPLKNVNPASNTSGWRLFYYDNYVYFVTRYMNGKPEFHIFDVSTPSAPVEIGGGTTLNTSIYGVVVQDRFIDGNKHRLAYLATTYDTNEVVVLDITDPENVKRLTGAYTDLPGNKDSRSIFLLGDKLYVGLESGNGSDFFILGTSNPLLAISGLPILGQRDVGTSVNDIFVSNQLAFLATTKSNKEFQIWRVAYPESITLIKEYNFGNIVEQGVDYEPDFIYATGQATPNFQILYSP
jgi:hypothetical protein